MVRQVSASLGTAHDDGPRILLRAVLELLVESCRRPSAGARPTLVPRNRRQPRTRVARPRPGTQRAERGDEDLLRGVLGLVPVAEDRATDRLHPGSMLEVEPLELGARGARRRRIDIGTNEPWARVNGGHTGTETYARLEASGFGSGGRSRADEPGFVRKHHSLDPVSEPKLLEDARDVRLRRVLADDQLRGDLGVRVTARDEAQHLELACGQRGRHRR